MEQRVRQNLPAYWRKLLAYIPLFYKEIQA